MISCYLYWGEGELTALSDLQNHEERLLEVESYIFTLPYFIVSHMVGVCVLFVQSHSTLYGKVMDLRDMQAFSYHVGR